MKKKNIFSVKNQFSLDDPKPGQPDKIRPFVLGLLVFLVFVLFAVAFFYKSWYHQMPAGADIPSHLYSSSFIVGKWLQLGSIPKINPYWYNSFEVVQNAAVFSYFPIGFLIYFLDKINLSQLVAGHLTYFFCTIAMGVGMYVLVRRKAGYLTSLLVSLAMMFSPIFQDQIVTGGSISRTFAFIAYPFAFYFLLNILENGSKDKLKLFFNCAIFSLLVAVSVLSHPMSGAAFLMFSLIYGLLRIFFDSKVNKKGFIYLVISLFLVFGLTAWYIMPFFIEQQGWITLHDQIINLFSVDFRGILLNIGGLGFIVIFIASLLKIKNWDKDKIIIFIIAIIFIIFSLGKYLPLYKFLPFLTEVYPFIFLMLGIFCLYYLIGSVLDLRSIDFRKTKVVSSIILLAFIFFIINNFRISYDKFFYKGTEHTTMEVASSNILKGEEGRVFPMKYPFGYLIYWLSIYEKPTVEGWYYSVTPTARHLAWLYDAIDYGYPDFAIRYLELTNTRYLLLNDNFEVILKFNNFPDSILRDNYQKFLDGMKGRGFEEVFDNEDYQIYRSKEIGYAQILNRRILAIGRTAFSAAAVLPDSVQTGSYYIDDYDLETLSHFPYLVLDGFKYHDKEKAEELIRTYAGNGGKVIIDLANANSNPLDEEYPEFLGVTGRKEKVNKKVNINIKDNGENTKNVNLSIPQMLEIGSNYGVIEDINQNVKFSEFKEWRFASYLNLDNSLVYYDKEGLRTTLIGYNKIGKGEAWFVGPNFFYYFLLANNLNEENILEELLNEIVPQDDYFTLAPEEFGITDFHDEPEHKKFSVHSSAKVPLIISYAYSPHWQILVDDKKVPIINIEDLVAINLSEGDHKVQMDYVSTWPRTYGGIVSIFSLLIILSIILSFSFRNFRKKQDN